MLSTKLLNFISFIACCVVFYLYLEIPHSIEAIKNLRPLIQEYKYPIVASSHLSQTPSNVFHLILRIDLIEHNDHRFYYRAYSARSSHT